MRKQETEVGAMSDEELDIAIAKLCPDLFVHVPSPFGPGCVHWREGQDDSGKMISPGAYATPTRDLNAMHEAEKVLTENHMSKWRDNLYNTVFASKQGPVWPWDECRATARQRAEAFVLTLGLSADKKNINV